MAPIASGNNSQIPSDKEPEAEIKLVIAGCEEGWDAGDFNKFSLLRATEIVSGPSIVTHLKDQLWNCDLNTLEPSNISVTIPNIARTIFSICRINNRPNKESF